MSDFRYHLGMAQALAGMVPPGHTIIQLHRRQCLCLREKLITTLDLVVENVESFHNQELVKYVEVLKELHHVVQDVKSFVDKCCYDKEDDFVLAATRVTAHRERFFQYHVELDWCSFLVQCLRDADAHGKPVYYQTLEKFDWDQKLEILRRSRDTRDMIANDEGDLKVLFESWVSKPGDHQAVCWALLRRLEKNRESDLPGELGVPPITSPSGIIGKGSYGVVYEIKWKENAFAVKCFDICPSDEVKILETCCHPHIVNLILAHKDDRKQYIMMDLLSKDLETYVKENRKQKRFSALEVVDMISQICEGMLYLNEAENEVSHRDLKPRNVLVKEMNPVTDFEIPAIELQVADFGLAKDRMRKQMGIPTCESENTANCGTTPYMDPVMTKKGATEKIRAFSSMKADMFSFALTSSFILTGREPYSEKDYPTTEAKKEAKQRGVRPELPGDCPPALATLLNRCWHRDQAQRPKNFNEILTELRKLRANLLTHAVDGSVTFNSGDRRLNILVLGASELVKEVINHICGAGSLHTQVQGCANLTENMNSSPPMCLYGDTTGNISGHNFTDIKSFVKARKERWSQAEVEKSWWREIHRAPRPPGEQREWIRGSTSRLHMVWFVCREASDLPNRFQWREITKDLPVQILVTGNQGNRDFDSTFRKIWNDRSNYFPKAQQFEDLIFEVALTDAHLKKTLWRKCWAAKTRAEIGIAANIIREIRELLGPSGKAVNLGVAGAARIGKEVSLSRSADLVLNFLCTYWDIPQDKLHGVLQINFTTFQQTPGNTLYNIKPREFVKFCLIVAASILYNARDNPNKPRYVCNWDVTPESSFGQLLRTESQECYKSYFVSSNSLSYYDKMGSSEMQEFLQTIFERGSWDSRPVVRNSLISRITDQIFPSRNRSGIMPEQTFEGLTKVGQ